MAFQLSEGALATIMNGGDFPSPVVQLLSLKKMNATSGQPEKDRYRAFLSDGKYSISFAMMTAPVYAKAGGDISKYSIVTINRYITSVINNTGGMGDSRVLLILDINVIVSGETIGERIGNPVPYTEASVTGLKSNVTRSTGGPSAPKVPKLMPAIDSSNISVPGNSSFNGALTHPISSLSPYHNKWIIKARVTNKTAVKTWSNSKGEGKLFSMDLVDESGEIRCTAFREQVDKFYDKIEVDKVYYISKCQLKPANKQFSSLKNDYEMSMVNETIIEECHDEDSSSIPQTQFNFTPISRIADLEPNTMIDIIGVAKVTGDLQTFQAKTTGRELKKKEVMLIDKSNTSVTLTLWGGEAENFDGSSNPVIVLKGARISEYGGGKTLSTVSGTLFRVNPDMQEAFAIKGWYDLEGSSMEVNNLSAKVGMAGSFNTPWMSFKQVVDDHLGNSEKGDYYQVKGTVLLVRKENCLYKACPTEDCNKKVGDQSNGMYKCEKCDRTFPNFKWRLLCSMNVGDWSGNQWISMFSSEAEKILNMTAEQAGELFESGNLEFNEAIEKAHFKQVVLKCRAKMENYNDEQRLKTVAVKVDPINHEEYNSYLINSINQLVNRF